MIDDLAFDLANQGFLNARLERAANKVESVKLKKTRMHLKWLVNTIFSLSFLVLLAFYVTIRVQQANGTIFSASACKKIDVQLGSAVYEFPEDVKLDIRVNATNGQQYLPGSSRAIPYLEIGETAPPLHYSYFSTDYWAETELGWFGRNQKIVELNGRPVYWENGIKDPTSGKFYYCEEIKSWVFTIEALFNTPGAMPEVAKRECESGWLMQSPVTTEEELINVDTSDWNVWTGQVEKVEGLEISCMECYRDADCGLIYGTCAENRTCVCNDGWQGDFCDVVDPYCPAIMWINYGESSSDYSIVGPYEYFMEMYGRPAYSDFTNQLLTTLNETELMIFVEVEGNFSSETFAPIFEKHKDMLFEFVAYTGRRWFDLYYTWGDVAAGEEIEELHPYWDDLFERNTEWFSEPTTSGMPVGLTWYNIRDSQSKGSFGPFGAHYEDPVGFECMDTKCTENEKVCGQYGNCTLLAGNEDKFEHNLVYMSFINYYNPQTVSACLCGDDYGTFPCVIGFWFFPSLHVR